MLFSSPIFLFGFLPLVLVFYYLAPKSAKNPVLLLASLIFYAWGEVFYVLIMLSSIVANYAFGLFIGQSATRPGNRCRAVALGLGVATNLLLLASFKYANFLVDNLNALGGFSGEAAITLAPVHLPLGLSFFTFQAISYLVDVYRGDAKPQRNLLDLGLFIALFPQLIAGPIVRYAHLAGQIRNRRHDVDLFYSGIERFVFGLAKKMLIANPLGAVADSIFAIPADELAPGMAWVGLLCYSLQIYFDFSGYSDMAIGLGRMFGFRFLENFNYPYIAQSLRDFWRRWHISLSTWFRDYLYFPLGGSRCGSGRVYLNLLLVFFLCGLWHGAAWNFVVWGLIHGFFLALERLGLGVLIDRAWRPVRHLYALAVIALAWVFFRADSLADGLDYFSALFALHEVNSTRHLLPLIVDREVLVALIVAMVLSMPSYPVLRRAIEESAAEWQGALRVTLVVTRQIWVFGLFFLCILNLAASTYNPFIYFRF